jgi:chemotaxis protein histidine kinase CheA
MSAEMEELLHVFFHEMSQHIEDIERCLRAKPAEQLDYKDISTILRACHAIKGLAGVTDKPAIVQHLVKMESRFRCVNEQQSNVSQEVVAECLAETDALHSLIQTSVR